MTPRNKRTDNARSYEGKKIGYPTRKETKGEEKMERILAENNSVEKPVPGILQSHERGVGVHLSAFDELKGYIATD